MNRLARLRGQFSRYRLLFGGQFEHFALAAGSGRQFHHAECPEFLASLLLFLDGLDEVLERRFEMGFVVDEESVLAQESSVQGSPLHADADDVRTGITQLAGRLRHFREAGQRHQVIERQGRD